MKMRVKKDFAERAEYYNSLPLSPTINNDMLTQAGKVIELSDIPEYPGIWFEGSDGWVWHKDWLEPVEEETPSFESEISRLIEAYPDKAEELKKMLPEVTPIVPRGWILKHPNGKTVLIATTQPELIQDHILLGNPSAFDFEIVTNGGFNYLKVIPK